MRTKIYTNDGFNLAEERRIKQIERTKLAQLLEKERRLANFLAEHHSTIILKNPRKPIEAVEQIFKQIYAHPEVKETANRINNILDAYREFRSFANNVRNRTCDNVREKLHIAVDAIRDPF